MDLGNRRRGAAMIKLGYKLMADEHGPTALIRNGKRAEQAGFDFAAMSNHFSPWLEEQGHAPFAFSVTFSRANSDPACGSDRRRDLSAAPAGQRASDATVGHAIAARSGEAWPVRAGRTGHDAAGRV
jgi:hypothetical protein